MTPSSRRAAFVGGLLLVAALPVFARVLEGPRGDRCSQDGLDIDPRTAARAALPGGGSVRFCGVECAQRWVARTGGLGARVLVTDDATGLELPARAAWYVRSAVALRAGAGNRIRAFSSREEAERHVQAYRGSLLEGGERPFGARVDDREGPR